MTSVTTLALCILTAGSISAQEAVASKANESVIEEATEKLFRDSFVIDGVLNYTVKKDPSCRQNCQVRLVGLGKMTATCGVHVGAITVPGDLAKLRRIHAYVTKSPGGMVIETFNDLWTARRDGKYGVLLYSQQVPMLQGNPAGVHDWYRLGMRIVQPAYSSKIPVAHHRRLNKLAGGSDEPAQGLTPLGRKVIQEMVKLHMIVDVSHCSEKTTMDVIRLTGGKVPILANHANAKALTVTFRGPMLLGRNKSNRELQAIAKTGGVIGINTVSWMLDRNADTRADMDDFLAHVDYVVTLVGIDHVGISSDAIVDGWAVDDIHYADAALASPKRWKILAQRLRKEYGYDREMLAKVLGGNFKRVYEAVLPGMHAPVGQHPNGGAVEPGEVTLSWLPARTRGLARPEYECRIEEHVGDRWVERAVHAPLQDTKLEVKGLSAGSQFRWQVTARSGRIEARSEPRTFRTSPRGVQR